MAMGDLYHFPCITVGCPEIGYCLWFPDFPDIHETGNSCEHLFAKAFTKLKHRLEDMLEKGKPIPEPTDLSELKNKFFGPGVMVHDAAVVPGED